ncbi:cupin domain-containing protein [Priestia filamentosa]|uniref:cupin domain-containing protein n=1 Tax=Priestia filamentosa TaxID=1402861 RepID=UPI00398242C1
MYYSPYMYSYPYYVQYPVFQAAYRFNPYEVYSHWYTREKIDLKDYGRQPFVVNIKEATKQNKTFRTALWTGRHLQVTLMSIKQGEDIGLETHPKTDQFLRVEEGQGLVQMGKTKNNLSFRERVSDDDAIMVPAGTWHNVTNTGDRPLKIYAIYAPPEHPFGTVHRTKREAEAAERKNELV